jgi:hypothetical protein
VEGRLKSELDVAISFALKTYNKFQTQKLQSPLWWFILWLFLDVGSKIFSKFQRDLLYILLKPAITNGGKSHYLTAKYSHVDWQLLITPNRLYTCLSEI